MREPLHNLYRLENGRVNVLAFRVTNEAQYVIEVLV